MTTVNAVGNALTGSTGTGAFVGSTSASLVTPNLGTPSAIDLSNATNIPWGSANGNLLGLQFLSGQITANQIKALHGTPIAVIPAQGANTIIMLHYIYMHYVYGTTPYTASASQSIRLGFGSTASLSISNTWFANAVLVGTQNYNSFTCMNTITSATDTAFVNVGLYAYNPQITEVTNGDSVINYYAQYTVLHTS